MFGRNLSDLAVLDQYVRLHEISDLPVERQHHAALQQDAALPLQTGKLGIGPLPALRRCRGGQSCAGGQTGTGLQERAAGLLVLGDGAHDRGARCEDISADPATGAGVGFMRLEASPDPVRVRAGFVTDADIQSMTTTGTRPPAFGGTA